MRNINYQNLLFILVILDLFQEIIGYDLSKGGGRLIGEACHFVDLTRDLIGFPIERISLNKSKSDYLFDTFTLNINFQDGSIASIHYFSNGNKSFPKETLQVFVDSNIFELSNFKT